MWRMWLLIPEGFVSVVQKPGEEELCVRARVREDLDRLRERFMPELGATVETRGGDYRYRAWIGRDDFAAGLARVAEAVTYGNLQERGRAARPGPRARVLGGLARPWRAPAGRTVLLSRLDAAARSRSHAGTSVLR
jgi:hypothetical protein